MSIFRKEQAARPVAWKHYQTSMHSASCLNTGRVFSMMKLASKYQDQDQVVVMILGLYVFLHHERGFKDGGA